MFYSQYLWWTTAVDSRMKLTNEGLETFVNTMYKCVLLVSVPSLSKDDVRERKSGSSSVAVDVEVCFYLLLLLNL